MKWNLRTKFSASLSVAMALLCVEAAVSQWSIIRVRGDIERVSQQSPIYRYARDLTESTAAEASVVGTYVNLHDIALLNGRAADQERQRLALARLDDVARREPYLATLIRELRLQYTALREEFPIEIASTDEHHAALASWMVLTHPRQDRHDARQCRQYRRRRHERHYGGFKRISIGKQASCTVYAINRLRRTAAVRNYRRHLSQTLCRAA